MTNRILVPLDNSAISLEVARFAEEYALKHEKALDFLHVHAKRDPDAEQYFEDFVARQTIKVSHQVLHRYGKSSNIILKTAEQEQSSMIVMASHSHTLIGRLLLGSNTDYLLHHAPCPVLVYKKFTSSVQNRILVPVDYSTSSICVIHSAEEWAARENAELFFLHIRESQEPTNPLFGIDPGVETMMFDPNTNVHHAQIDQKLHETLTNELHQYLNDMKLNTPWKATVKYGIPYLLIVESQIEIQAKLVMMAAHSQSFAERMFLGGTTDYLAHHSGCPIYVFRAPPN
ncbi:MAG: universal stress protein [SAR324 cluster bacterium]|nr:universal stress protein [SAR324 cluster bacterium]